MSIKSIRAIELGDDAWSLVRQLVRTPFISRQELAFLSDVSIGKTSDALLEGQAEGVIDELAYMDTNTDLALRFYLTRRGVRLYLMRAGMNIQGTTEPITREWYISLLRRLDTVKTVYRIARSFVPVDKNMAHHTPRVTWYRRGNWDASLRFHNGAVVPILVQGRDWGLDRFMRRIYDLERYEGDLVGGALLVTPDVYSRNRALQKIRLTGTRINAFACVESDIHVAKSVFRIWQGTLGNHGIFNAVELLPRFEPRGRELERKPVKNASLPPPQIKDEYLLWSKLRGSEKRYLSLISKSLLIRREDFRRIVGVSRQRSDKVLKNLRDAGLIENLKVNGDKRLTLSDAGIRAITYRDRLSIERGIDQRSPSLREDGKFRGSMLRTTVKNLTHDDNVNNVVGLFAEHARAEKLPMEFALSWHMHRRYLDGNGRPRQLSPDALITLRKIDLHFVEVEFRAIKKRWITSKLRPYIHYYKNEQWKIDMLNKPRTLFLVSTPANALEFLKLAVEMMRDAETLFPFGVADIDALTTENAVSKRIWLTAASLRSGDRYSLSQNRYFGQ